VRIFGAMPLSYLRDFISLKYLFKTQAQPESPTYRAIIENPHEANSVRERIRSLHKGDSIPNPQIWKIITLEFPPWRLQITLNHKEEHNNVQIQYIQMDQRLKVWWDL